MGWRRRPASFRIPSCIRLAFGMGSAKNAQKACANPESQESKKLMLITELQMEISKEVERLRVSSVLNKLY